MKKNDFCATGYKTVSNLGGIEIEVNNCGDSVRFRLYGEKVTTWRPVHETLSGRVFAFLKGKKEYLDSYMRTNF